MACADEKIKLALVHDSFASLPNDAGRLRSVLLDRLHWLYSHHDVLGNLKAEVLGSLDDKTVKATVPTKGSLDINQVLRADYAFS